MNSDSQLNKATEQIHIAAQYLAMAGKYFLPPKDDDSHTNLGWDLDTQQFFSHRFSNRGVKLFLRPSDLRLSIGADPEDLLAQQNLQGLTQEQGSSWIKVRLKQLGLDPTDYRLDFHYQLPAYGDFEDQTFEIIDSGSHRLFSEVRGWAKKIIVQFKNSFHMAEDDRTWPHHFDHGCYVPLVKNKASEVICSISFGLAIHDDLQSSHYLYVTHWAAERLPNLIPPKLDHGNWEMEQINGALLPISVEGDVAFGDQTERAQLFMKEAIDASLDFLGLDLNEKNA